MKYLSIIGFLAMVVFFTLWSMYEDNRKRVINEDFSGELLRWSVEGETGQTRFTFDADTLNIFTPSGLTLWYDHKLNGNYRISFSILERGKASQNGSPVMLGCLWAASDPEHPDNLFFNSNMRGKNITTYDSLQLYYAIREYNDSLRIGKNPKTTGSSSVWTSSAPNQTFGKTGWNAIEIKVENGVISFSVNNVSVIQKKDNSPYIEGYFGIYLENSDLRLTDFEIKLLK